ncbi:MAG: hypothetical protein EOM50_13120 [Erysipelotrichia bacterium]|nr:hypothetical protein [Erysipelotrichia bacterium]NCC54162.1 hypothetical protein [Erysipelotrichia bacterium]
MKKFMLFVSVYVMFLLIPFSSESCIKAENDTIKYRIYMDSHASDLLTMKEEVLAIMDYLCADVDEDSYAVMLANHLAMFETLENTRATWKKNTLFIYQGDGKGSYMKGKYQNRKVCLEEVKPKSKIKEWLGME